jgi:hypothetical protein
VNFRSTLIIALVLLPTAATAQTRGGAQRQQVQQELRQGGAGTPQQRRALEEQVFNRFVNRVSTDMRLDAPNRARLEQFLRRSQLEHRLRAQQTTLLRRQLNQAVRDSTISDTEITRLLAQMEQLKLQDDEQWKRDQTALAQMVGPRQRAVFILQWMQFNERIRDIMADRPGAIR